MPSVSKSRISVWRRFVSWNSSTITALKALRLARPDLGARAEEVTHTKLEVFEVERRFSLLRLAIGLGEEAQQLLEQITIPRRELLERGSRDPGAGDAEGSGPFAATP